MNETASDTDLPRCQDCGYQGRQVRRLSPRAYVGAIPFTLVGLLIVVAYPLSIVALAAIGYWIFVKKTCPKCKSENINSSPDANGTSDLPPLGLNGLPQSTRGVSQVLPTQEPQTVKGSSGRTLWIVAGVGGILFLLFFHIVPSRMVVFPKASPSFADTFIDVDEFLKHYNEGSFIDQIAIRQTYVFRQLREKGIIVTSNERDQKPDSK